MDLFSGGEFGAHSGLSPLKNGSPLPPNDYARIERETAPFRSFAIPILISSLSKLRQTFQAHSFYFWLGEVAVAACRGAAASRTSVCAMGRLFNKRAHLGRISVRGAKGLFKFTMRRNSQQHMFLKPGELASQSARRCAMGARAPGKLGTRRRRGKARDWQRSGFYRRLAAS